MSEEAFQFLAILLCLLVILDLIFKRFYSLDVYPFESFHIEPLIIHLYMNDVVI
jgi:hypothetical protein